MKNSKVVNINTDMKGLMKYWLKFTQPFHNLRPQQQSILALLLHYYFIYKKDTDNEEMIWKMVFDYETKMKIKEELDNLPDYTLQNNLTTLRKQNIIQGNKIAKAYIPTLELNANIFTIAFKFNISEEND